MTAVMWGQLPVLLMLAVLILAGFAFQAATGNTPPESLRMAANGVGLVWSTGTTASTVAVVNGFDWRRGFVVALVPLTLGVMSYL